MCIRLYREKKGQTEKTVLPIFFPRQIWTENFSYQLYTKSFNVHHVKLTRKSGILVHVYNHYRNFNLTLKTTLLFVLGKVDVLLLLFFFGSRTATIIMDWENKNFHSNLLNTGARGWEKVVSGFNTLT